jgi:hypothetical protein
MDKHPNSYEVTVFRIISSVHKAQDAKDEMVQDYLKTGNMTIGSYWKSTKSKQTGSGLTPEEVNLLMPEVLNMDANDREFRKEVFRYFAEMLIRVPFGIGLKLEIGLKKSNDEPLSADNLPIDFDNYVRYRFLREHPMVSTTLQQSDSHFSKWFWIMDPKRIEKEKDDLLSARDKATRLYMEIREDNYRMDVMLTLLGIDVTLAKYAGQEGLRAKLHLLRDFADKQPELFIETHEQKNFNELFWIKMMLQKGVLRKVGEIVLDPQGERIGSSELEASYWLKDPRNSEKVSIFKSQVQYEVKAERAEKVPVGGQSKKAAKASEAAEATPAAK